MLLDDLRYNNLGRCALYFTKKEGSQIIIDFEDESLIHTAIDLTIRSLKQLENSTEFAHTGHDSLAALVLWFNSIESFFARIVKVVSLYKDGVNYDSLKNASIIERIVKVCTLLGFEENLFSKKSIKSQLKEFTELRNLIFHARALKTKTKFKKTAFTKDPLYINQVDVMQAADIAISLIDMFRYIIPELDIASSYRLISKSKQSIKFISVVDYYEKVLYPAFISILKKHNLKTTFEHNSDERMPISTLTADITRIKKVEMDDAMKTTLNPASTSIVEDKLSSFVHREFSDVLKDSIKLFNARVSKPYSAIRNKLSG